MMQPRLEDDEVKYLKEFLANKPDGQQMIEWGSGGSTLMFIPYFATGLMVSIEHNSEWIGRVMKGIDTAMKEGDLKEECVNNFVYCITPELPDKFYGYGVPYEENPCFADRYINPRIPNINPWDSDIYFVDGICRGPILATIAMRANRAKNPAIFLHDHHGPENRKNWYSWATSFFSKTEEVGSTLARLHL